MHIKQLYMDNMVWITKYFTIKCKNTAWDQVGQQGNSGKEGIGGEEEGTRGGDLVF